MTVSGGVFISSATKKTFLKSPDDATCTHLTAANTTGLLFSIIVVCP
jgi:hypothetical protein